MCGILGLIGMQDCQNELLDRLKYIQNRGYDSAGVCTITDNKEFNLIKYASDNDSALVKIEKKLNESNLKNMKEIGIAHTRWATNGEKSDRNAHPHIDMYDTISLVHNGIIENYCEIKDFLIEQNYKFISETDSEVIVNLISYHFKCTNNMELSINLTVNMLKGTFALCIINKNESDKIYSIKRDCPLLVSLNTNNAMISSECSGFSAVYEQYVCLEDDNLFVLKLNEKTIMWKNNFSESFNNLNHLTEYYEIRKIQKNDKNCLEPFNYWIEKEINEQKFIVKNTTKDRITKENQNVELEELNKYKKELSDIQNIIILGCGTSYNAGLIGMNILKDLCKFNIIYVYDGAEFYERDLPIHGNTLMILLSQSGETKDLYRCIEIAKKNNIFTIGIINVVDSLIAREVNTCIYLGVGKEISVASTKSFSGLIVVMSLLAMWFSKNESTKKEYLDGLFFLDEQISKVMENSDEFTSIIAEYLLDKTSLFILGKEKMESISKEASLKIKEISYIHAEGYSSSSLKHGSYALLCSKFPIIVLCPNDVHLEKNKIIIEELKSRKAYVIVISDDDQIKSKADISYYIPKNNKYNCILSNIIIQIISYKLAILKGHNPDFPKNLAKVVTVD